MDILITTNAPGEIATWVKPVVRAIRMELQDVRIICLLPFCQFASGKEIDLLLEIPEIELIITMKEYLKVLLTGRLPLKSKRLVVLHLGGDPIYSLLVSKRLGLKAAIYTYRVQNLIKYFERIMVLDDESKERLIRMGVKGSRVEVVGDLIVDSLSDIPRLQGFYERYSLNKDKPIIGLLAGSRKEHVRYSLPFLLKVAEYIKEILPQSQFITLLSPTIKDSLTEILNLPLSSSIEGSKGILDKETILTETIRVAIVKEGIEVMRNAHIVITIPGSNTGQLAALGIPMVVITPLNIAQVIPLEGIWGLVDRIPWIGGYLKGYIVRKMSKSIPFTAIPNIRAKRIVVPEMLGILRPVDVARKAIDYLKELDRDLLSRELLKIMGPRGASIKVARTLLQM